MPAPSRNVGFLVVIGALSVLGLALLCIRLALSLFLDVPQWFFPTLVFAGFFVVWLFPSITGSAVTAVLAKRVGFLSLKLDTLELWNFYNIRAEGIVLESPSMGVVRIQSVQIKPNWNDLFVNVEVCNLTIEMTNNTPATPRKTAARKKKSRGSNKSMFSMLKLVHHVQVNVDYVQVKRGDLVCRVRDFTGTVGMRGGEYVGPDPLQQFVAHASLGMLSVSVVAVTMDVAPHKQTTLPPLVQLNQASLWFHLNSAVTAAELTSPARPIAPQRGCCLAIGLFKVSASSASLLALKRSSKSSAPSNTAVAPPPPPMTTFHPFVQLVQPMLEELRLDPTTLFVERLAFDWYNTRGVCVSVNATALDCRVAKSGLVVKLGPTSCTSHVDSGPFASLEHVHLEMLDEQEILQVAVVLHKLDLTLKPASLSGLEHAHMEWLRYVARTRAVLDLEVTPPTTTAASTGAAVLFQGTVEVATTGGVSCKLESDRGSKNAHSVCVAFDSVAGKFATVNQREKYVKWDGAKMLVDNAVALALDKGKAELESALVLGANLEGVVANVAVGAVFRAFQLWLQFSPRVDHWQDVLAEVRASELLPNSSLNAVAQPPPPHSTAAAVAIKLHVQSLEVNLLLGNGGKGVRIKVSTITLTPDKVLELCNLDTFALDDGESVSILQIQTISAAVATREVQVVGTHVCVPAKIGSKQFAGGEILQAYFGQRKALRIAMNEARELVPLSANRKFRDLTSATPDLVRDDSDVDKLAFSVRFKQVFIKLEDDDVADRQMVSFFPTERRRVGSLAQDTGVLTMTCPSISVRGHLITAWRSQVQEPITDLSLLKRSPGMLRAHRRRAYVLKQVYEFDSSACPKPRMERAFLHGFADLISLELDEFQFGPGMVLLSDYPVPIMCFDALEMKQCGFVFADLKATSCSTTAPRELVLGELGSGDRNNAPVTVMATSSLAPVKLYFKVPTALFANLQMSYGECMSPALFALDRALGRALPPSSDKSSPKLGWWDKMRYMCHGTSQFVMDKGLMLRFLTRSPWMEEDCILVRAALLALGSGAEEDQTHPTLELDQRVWDAKFTDYSLWFCKSGGEGEGGAKFPVLTLPRVYTLVSFAWRCRFGGDHYVQLQHDELATMQQVGDQYAHFRAQSLDVGLDFEVKRAEEDDYLSTDKCPMMQVCWRQMYPVLCACLRGVFPPRAPVAVPVEPLPPTLAKCLTKITFNTRCSRPHIAYWEDDSATTAFLLRGKRLDSQVVLCKTSEDKWEHERLLAQFFAVEAFILTKSGNGSKPGQQRVVDFEREFGLGETDYCFGVSLPQEPFFCCPNMRLTLGGWTKLVGAAESQLFMGEPQEEREDSTNAYILCVDGTRLMWTLSIRNDVSRFFATVSYVMRREVRYGTELAQQLAGDGNAPLLVPPKQDNQRCMDLSLLFNRSLDSPEPGGNGDEMSAKMAKFLHTAQLAPIVCEDMPQDDVAYDAKINSRDRPSACSTAEISADMLKSTWEETSRSFTLDLRRPQVCLQWERNVLVLASKSATMRNFYLNLVDWLDPDTCLLRKEMDVEISQGEMFATVLGDGVGGTRCIRMLQSKHQDYDGDLLAFDSARGCVRRTANGQQFLEAALGVIGKRSDKRQALLDARAKRLGGEGNFYDITSLQDQDPHLERIGSTDRFQATNIVYTDTSGGAKVPSSHLGVKLRRATASLKSKEFFAVLSVLRNLLLEAPPPDVKELSMLTQQEAIDELKRRWRSVHPSAAATASATMASAAATVGEEEEVVVNSEAELKAHVERVSAGRLNAKRLRMCSQRIIYEVEEFNVTLKDQEDRIHSQVFGMRGDHSFSPDGSTKVDFEIADLKVYDLQTTAQIMECQLLEGFQNAQSRAPFLRADAMTSTPIHALGYRVTVYELIQVHLFPGTRYRFRTRVSQSIANFVRKYISGDDDAVQQPDAVIAVATAATTSLHPSNGSLGGDSHAPTSHHRSSLELRPSMDSHAPSDSPRSAQSLPRSADSGVAGSSQTSLLVAATTNTKPVSKSRFSIAGLFVSAKPLSSSSSLQRRSMDEDEEEDQGSFDRVREEVAPAPAVPGSSQLIVRAGTVTRLSVPKPLQLRPEPTVQPWNSTVKRKTILQLVVRKQEAFLELHRSEMGLRVGVPPRTVVRLQDICRIQRHGGDDDGAPEGTIDVFYNVELGPMRCQGVFTWVADEPGWNGSDKALPWIAALAPGLGREVLNAFFKQELKLPSLEVIWKRSAAAMGHPNVLFAKLHPPPLQRRSQDDLTAHPRRSDLGGESQSPPSRDEDNEEDDKDDEEEYDSEDNNRAGRLRHQISSSVSVPFGNKATAIPLLAELPQRREINFFKYLRVGQVQVELTLQGFPFVNNLQRNAYCPAEVYHSQLWTWYKAFKIVQRYEVLSLLTSYLRGGSGANWEDNTSNPLLLATTTATPSAPPSPSNHSIAATTTTTTATATTSTGFFKRRPAPVAAPPPPQPDESVPHPPAAVRERRRSDTMFFGPQEEFETDKLELLFGSRGKQTTKHAAAAAAATTTTPRRHLHGSDDN
ncbi:hypothetical protein BASA81_002600 [Batrachochytrium salamandrivorans]|nr:hypothetical protein BASA81_002600 [Batrachochytrium salamandrivorans]